MDSNHMITEFSAEKQICLSMFHVNVYVPWNVVFECLHLLRYLQDPQEMIEIVLDVCRNSRTIRQIVQPSLSTHRSSRVVR